MGYGNRLRQIEQKERRLRGEQYCNTYIAEESTRGAMRQIEQNTIETAMMQHILMQNHCNAMMGLDTFPREP